jgi:DNA-binding NarL/FixJ family response regulator
MSTAHSILLVEDHPLSREGIFQPRFNAGRPSIYVRGTTRGKLACWKVRLSLPPAPC